MLSRGTDELTASHAKNLALPAFNTYNLEITAAICEAAGATGEPVLVQAGSSSFGYGGRAQLSALVLAAAEEADAPVGVHLDHCRDLEELRWCAEAGYTSVMVDGSHLPFEDNVALTRGAVAIGRANGVWVEGELGAVPGDEDVSAEAHAEVAMTDPRAAARFAEETGVDALAVAIGNVHGTPRHAPFLDLDRLAEIHRLCGETPLVLHGASGVDDATLAAALDHGVAKVNVNTELRAAYLAGLDGQAGLARGRSVAAAMDPARRAVREVAEAKIRLLRKA